MITKDWTCKGFDLTFDGYRGWSEKKKNKVLYPYDEAQEPNKPAHKKVFVDAANGAVGVNMRIKIVDNAITKAKRLT